MVTRIPSAPFYVIETPKASSKIKGPIMRQINVYPCSTHPQAVKVARVVDGVAVVVSFTPPRRLFREYVVLPTPRV